VLRVVSPSGSGTICRVRSLPSMPALGIIAHPTNPSQLDLYPFSRVESELPYYCCTVRITEVRGTLPSRRATAVRLVLHPPSSSPTSHHLLINFDQLKSKHPGRSLPGLAETHHSSFHAEFAWSGLQRARTKQNSSQVFHLALNYNSLLCRGTDLERKSRAYHLQANPHPPPPHLKLLSPTLSASPCLYSLATTSSYPYMLVA